MQHMLRMAHSMDRLVPMVTRRRFSAIFPAAALASVGFAAPKLSLHVGHTGLTWIPLGGGPGAGPRPAINPMQDPQYAKAAIRDISALGFYGIELFGDQIQAMEAQGGVGALLSKHDLPLISAYCNTNLSDPAARKDSIAKTVGWAQLVKKYNSKVIVVGPNGVRRNGYDFQAHKSDIVATLNELGKAVSDLGLTAVLHQHTGTCVETHDETYAVMEAVDTRVMNSAPTSASCRKAARIQ